jgi:molybdopterin synthase sulfur carrier subunit
MAVVWIPALLRDLSGGKETVEVAGETVGQVIEALDALYPGMRSRLCDSGALRPNLAVVVDGHASPRKLRQRVSASSEIHFLSVMSGG